MYSTVGSCLQCPTINVQRCNTSEKTPLSHAHLAVDHSVFVCARPAGSQRVPERVGMDEDDRLADRVQRHLHDILWYTSTFEAVKKYNTAKRCRNPEAPTTKRTDRSPVRQDAEQKTYTALSLTFVCCCCCLGPTRPQNGSMSGRTSTRRTVCSQQYLYVQLES